MRNPWTELAAALVLAAFILTGFYLTGRIDLAFSSDLETISGPRAYPNLILSVLLLCNLAIVAGLVRRLLRDPGPPPDLSQVLPDNAVRPAGLLVALIGFVLAFEQVGYILTMVPLLTVTALLCGAKGRIRAFLVSLGLAAVCLIVFRYGLATVLPEGLFGIDMFV